MKENQGSAGSLVEVFVVGLVNFLVVILAMVIAFPWFEIWVGFGAKLGIACVFTVMSWVTSYNLRRWFTSLD